MKIKIFNGLLIIDICTICLILAIIFIPSSIARIILGIPFLLFFPGYALVTALFINRNDMNSLERVTISIAMSIAIVALIGLCLNYLPWGIRLEPVLYSIAIFTFIMSIITFIRRPELLEIKNLKIEFGFKLYDGNGDKINKYLSITLIVAIIGALGALGYSISAHNTNERFTEFYILGFYGNAQDYPTEFVLRDGLVTSVRYGTDVYDTANAWGKITLGIVNHEQQTVNYSIKVTMDNQPLEINYRGNTVTQLGDIVLQQGEKWEQEITFIPQHIGDNQKMEISLFDSNNAGVKDTLHLFINVKAAAQE